MFYNFPEDSVFLVTGGAGFIGSNLCEVLLELGYKVRCLDDLSNGLQSNVDIFTQNPNYQFIHGDIRDYETCMIACKDVDYVLHQAAWGSVPRSIELPLLYESINVGGTLNMLEASRKNGVKRFVYASSSSVYGDEPNLPKIEGREGNLLSPYALTKKSNEGWAKQYTLHYGLATYGLRYFNVFGKRQNPNSTYAAVIPKFINCMMNGEDVTIYGDGTQSRDFTFIDNVVHANLLACLASEKHAGLSFNVACGEQITLLQLVDELRNLLDFSGGIKFFPKRRGDILHSNADFSLAKEKLGFQPVCYFMDGIQKTVEWYAKQRRCYHSK